jgi:3-dehydroquinate synthase
VSDTILQRVSLVLEYPVVFTRDAFDPANPALAGVLARHDGRRQRCVAIIDAGVAAAWPQLAAMVEAYALHHDIELAAAPWQVPGGEVAKQREVLDAIVERLVTLRMDRHAFVIAIGGGAALDVIGCAAALVHRGVRLVRLPTTVLAQNDAGIGVKNGINAFGAKNLLGTFAAPFAVVADSAFLHTLAARDRAAGMAEAVKVAAIRDAGLFEWLEAHAGALAAFELDVAETMIRRCAELHLRHIATSGDPFELGNARPLDFGHWAAHKLELLTRHELRHGEAVAIGMAVDTTYSRLAGLLDAASCARLLALLRALQLPTWHPALRAPALLDGLAEFREHLGGELTITLLHGLGVGRDARDIDDDLVRRAIDELEP